MLPGAPIAPEGELEPPLGVAPAPAGVPLLEGFAAFWAGVAEFDPPCPLAGVVVWVLVLVWIWIGAGAFAAAAPAAAGGALGAGVVMVVFEVVVVVGDCGDVELLLPCLAFVAASAWSVCSQACSALYRS